jgi:uncharacterized LabA/DUF88 family protein
VRRAAPQPRRARSATLAALAVLGPLAASAAGASHLPPDTAASSARPADRGRGPQGGDLRVLQGRQVSMDEAIEMAQRRFNARVVRAEVAERDGRRVYVLRLLSEDGRVFNVRVDAATGSMQ